MNVSQRAAEKSRFRVIAGGRPQSQDEELECKRADALFFRGQTLAIVRHFFEIASQIGRLPSILGREFFRAKVSHRGIPSFEDQAVFVHDVERALGRLREDDAEVVALVGLFRYPLDDVAAMLGRSRSCVSRRYADSIDQLAEMFLETGLLRENRPDRHVRRFAVEEPPEAEAALPAKKPVGSVGADEYHIVAQASGGEPLSRLQCDA
jgi:hypothetical protein